MRLTCAIIDDEPLAVSLLESYVLKTPFLDLQGTYNSALDALSDLRDRPVDLLFLDIQMPELSGLEFSRILNADTRVIFTTAFDRLISNNSMAQKVSCSVRAITSACKSAFISLK